MFSLPKNDKSRDVDPVLSYADPDPPNLMNAESDPVLDQGTRKKFTKFFKK